MGSPVKIPFQSFIILKPKDETALYLQIVFEFIKAIQMGLLPEGTKLPGTRLLCKLLAVNRNTLIKAFSDLESQGWIEIQPNKGTFILSRLNKATKAETVSANSVLINNTGFTFKRSAILDDPIEQSSLPIQFNDGQPDIRLLQTDIIARLYVSKLKKQSGSKSWLQNPAVSHNSFKAHFANYLNLTRGLKIALSNLLVTNSHESSLYLVAKLLLQPKDRVVVAAPGYYRANMTLLDTGADIVSIPADEDGIETKQLKKICRENPFRALYLTSNYHYPTTAVLSAKRRIEILELANEFGFVIIEDDYDFDFHHDNNPALPLAAFDDGKKVVYIGSFGRTLPPGFGYGFVTGPTDFISELQKHLNVIEPQTDVIKEQVLTEWIKEGEVHRLYKKNSKLYKERRDCFINLLDANLKGRIKYKTPARWLAVWVEWQDSFNLMHLQKACATNGLFLPKIILYQNKSLIATRLGFGHLSMDEMRQAVEILSSSLNEVLKQ